MISGFRWTGVFLLALAPLCVTAMGQMNVSTLDGPAPTDSSDSLASGIAPPGSAQSDLKETHVTVNGFSETGGPESVTLPTTAGTVQFDMRPAGPHSPRAKKARPEENPASELFSGQTIALSLVILSASYLIASFWFKKGSLMRGRPLGNTAEKSALSDTNYPIVRVIGQGGMGVVYEAVDRVLDRKVAIKKMREEISQNVGEFEQFLKEAKTVASLHHPAIVDIHSIVEQGGEIYLVFEYVEGKTVEALLTEKGRLSLGDAKRILEPVCQALDFAHGRQVIHRDLKPANVMVTHQGFVKVMDFGISRRVKDTVIKSGASDTRYDMTNSIVGTPLYMAPEAEKGVLCPQSDVYSLGVMTYEMLAGKPPFSPPVAIDQKIGKSYPPLSKAVAEKAASLDAFIDAALEPDPEKRIPSAREFWKRLSSLA